MSLEFETWGKKIIRLCGCVTVMEDLKETLTLYALSIGVQFCTALCRCDLICVIATFIYLDGSSHWRTWTQYNPETPGGLFHYKANCHSIVLKLSIFWQQQEWLHILHKISCCSLQVDAKTCWSYFSTPETHFVDVSFILLVTCRCDSAGSRASFVSSQKPLAVDTNIIGHSWNTHHLTCHTVTITSTTWRKHEV